MGIWEPGGGVLPTGKGWRGNGNLEAHPKDLRLRCQGRELESLRLCPPYSWYNRVYQTIFKHDVGFCTYFSLRVPWAKQIGVGAARARFEHAATTTLIRALWRALGVVPRPPSGFLLDSLMLVCP